jgi:phosphoribosyl 1,2-cyclic phosphodiesterase
MASQRVLEGEARTEAVVSGREPAAIGMSVTFHGVRGSAPVSGADHVVFGGGTMCLEVACGRRRLIVDAGSGLRSMGRLMHATDERRVEILLTHFHIDHVMGLMGFAPLFQAGAAVIVHAPILGTLEPEAIVRRLFDGPFFPMTPESVGASLTVRSFRPGDAFAACGFEIATIALSHPGGACGYRIARGGESLAAIFDHEHGSDEPERELASFCAGADLLLYDAQWDEAVDYAAHRGWGHSTWQAGLRLLHAAGARRLGCLHHAPESTTSILSGRERALQAAHAEGFFAREGASVRLRPPWLR